MVGIVEYISYISIFASLYFEVFLLISFLENKEVHNDEEFTPGVTVLVPCFNEEKTVQGTLESLLQLDYPKEKVNIIVINDGSTDNTREILKAYENNPQIQIHDKVNGGKYTALNLGISLATTDFIGCLDADSFVDKDALRLIMKRFQNENTMAVTPSMIVDKPNNILREMQKAEYHFGNFTRKSLSILGAIHITPGPFSFFRKEVFQKIGLYRHAHNTEDMEMAMRMQKNGMVIENEPKAHVFTVGPDTVKKLYRQRVRWVSGFLGNMIDYREMLFNKKYGNLGIVVLPFAVFGLVAALTLIAITAYNTLINIWTEFAKLYIVGLGDFSIGSFDWFYINTSAITMLSFLLLSLTIFSVFFGQKLATGKWKLSISPLYFVFLYSFLLPFWLLKAVYNNAVRKDASWR